MDFGDLIILLLFLAPFLGRIFGKKPQPGVPGESPTGREIEDPLADALRQIREALGEDVPSRGLDPDPEPVVDRRATPNQRSAFEAADTEFRPVGEFEHDAHGFGRQNPLSEEVFEQRPAFVTTGGTDPIGTHTPPPVDLTTPIEVEKPTSSAGPSLASILRDPQRAREAFILHEVFDGPRSRRGPRRRR